MALAGRRATDALLVLALALAALAAAGAALGVRAQVVLTGSMRPGIQPGDLVVARTVQAGQLRRGDVVTFGLARLGGRTVTHRVQIVLRDARGVLHVTTRGDANSASEGWDARPGDVVGRRVAQVPRVGLATRWLAPPEHRLPVFAGLALVMLVGGLRWAWRD